MLLQLWFDESEREARAVDRDVALLQRIRQAADVVFMAMREYDADQLAVAAQQGRDVRQDQVDAEHVLLRKHQAGVDREQLVLPLEGPHVDADLTEATQREVAQALSRQSRRSCSPSCFGGAAGTGGGGGARSFSRYALTRSKSCSRSATSETLCSAAAG